jgi:hypothetical protein
VLAVDALDIYWVGVGTTAGGMHDGVVMKLPRDLSTGPVQLAGSQEAPMGLALDARYVYWITVYDEKVQRVPKAGGPVDLVHQAVGDGVAALAVDDTSIYWLGEFNKIFRVAK